MKKARKIVLSTASCLIAVGASAQTQTPGGPPVTTPGQYPPGIVTRQGTVVKPPSDVAGRGFNHTNYRIFVPAGQPSPAITPDTTLAEYPDSIGCVYKVGPIYSGCVPGVNGDHPKGGWGAIALVDAYDDPNAATDLAYFDSYFGIPTAKFKTVIANSSFGTLGGLTASCSGTPANANTTGWDLEESLDIEWAHVMAPSATIILVEACSNSDNDLYFAELVAGQEVAAYGGGDISNSWGGGEYAGEVNSDAFFYRTYWDHITYFASAGDTASEVSYPSASPWVISAGGTTINRDSNGNFLSESCWTDSGGGSSTVETWQNPPNISNGMGPWTPYQFATFGGGAFRSTPDMSFDADPNSGVWVRDTDPTNGGGWYVVGGTSLSSPALAGLVNSAVNKLGQGVPGGYYTAQENNLIYSQLYAAKAYAANFYDVNTGSNGHAAVTGYDQCTGVGSPRGKLGK